MTRIPLEEFIAQKGLSEAARRLRVTPPALSKALATERSIYVTEHDDGTLTAEEVRPFPSQNSKQPTAA